eukprot:1233895-Pleurochrysis_carterae.AAC.4
MAVHSHMDMRRQRDKRGATDVWSSLYLAKAHFGDMFCLGRPARTRTSARTCFRTHVLASIHAMK